MKRKYWILLVFCFGVLALDQWSKYIVMQKLPLYHHVEVIKNYFYITHSTNTGGLFGFLGGEKGGHGSILFTVASLIAIGAIVYLFMKLKGNEKLLAFSFSLILSGALGNLIDRLRYGEVTDFLDVYLPFIPVRILNPWPTFNIADSAICVGIGLMALELFIQEFRNKPKSPTKLK
jgi:signal peptidase II